MIDYPFESVLINNKEVSIRHIVNESVTPSSEFEKETFLFIRQWVTEEKRFTLQTSGSTGSPSTISFTRSQLEASAHATIQALGLKKEDTALVCLNTKYVAGKMMLVRAFINHMRIVAVEPSSNPLANCNVKIDFAAFVPMQMKVMLDAKESSTINSIKTILIGGSPIDAKLRHQIISTLSSNAFLTYGMTETLSHIALQNLMTENKTYDVLPGGQISIDNRGCLVINLQYLDSPVVTNDLVELSTNKSFRWLGRIDNIINTGGIKVNPESIEDKLGKIFESLGITNRYFIAGLPHEALGEMVTLFMEGDLSQTIIDKLDIAIQGTLGLYEAPRKIVYLKRFQDTETGKISRFETLKILNNPV